LLGILGGATRAGKGLISRKLVERTATPLLSLDVLKMGLSEAVPSLGVDPNTASSEVGRRMWPLVKAMARNAVESGTAYIFEGDMLLPGHAVELRDLAGDDVRACFVGYADVEPRQKLQELRHFSGLPNDWLNEHSDEYVLTVIEDGIQFSRSLADECDRLDLRYFDCSFDFEGTVDSVVDYLSQTP
jgi:hypothetical protein